MSTTTSPPVFQTEPAMPRTGARAVQNVLLASGVLSSLAYVAANLVAAMRWDGYSFASQTISELSAIGAPSRPTWVVMGILYDVLLLAFGVGVWRCAHENRRLRVTAGMLLGIVVLGVLWPPMHLRGSVPTLTDTLHVVFASVVSLLILLAIGFGATVAGKGFRRYSIATIGLLLVFGTLSFLDAPRIAAGLPTPWVGVLERINLGGYLLWVAVLALVLLRENQRDAKTVVASSPR
jgi:hypothetical protein